MQEMTEEQRKMASEINKFFGELGLEIQKLQEKQNGLKELVNQLIQQIFILHAMIEPKLTEEEKEAAIKKSGEMLGKLSAMQKAEKQKQEEEPKETVTMQEIFHRYWEV